MAHVSFLRRTLSGLGVVRRERAGRRVPVVSTWEELRNVGRGSFDLRKNYGLSRFGGNLAE